MRAGWSRGRSLFLAVSWTVHSMEPLATWALQRSKGLSVRSPVRFSSRRSGAFPIPFVHAPVYNVRCTVRRLRLRLRYRGAILYIYATAWRFVASTVRSRVIHSFNRTCTRLTGVRWCWWVDKTSIKVRNPYMVAFCLRSPFHTILHTYPVAVWAERY